MNDRNTTLFALNALPVSPRPLMGFDSLQHLRCTPLETAYITPASQWTAHGPEGNIFEYPIQITVLGIRGQDVDLGIYVHPSLRVQRGPQPKRAWRQRWQHALFLRQARRQKAAITKTLPHLCQQFKRLRDLHCFCYDTLKTLMGQEASRDPTVLAGLEDFLRSLQKQDQEFEQALGQLWGYWLDYSAR